MLRIRSGKRGLKYTQIDLAKGKGKEPLHRFCQQIGGGGDTRTLREGKDLQAYAHPRKAGKKGTQTERNGGRKQGGRIADPHGELRKPQKKAFPHLWKRGEREQGGKTACHGAEEYQKSADLQKGGKAALYRLVKI